MKKFIQGVIFVMGMASCGFVQALSADAPPVDWKLKPISEYTVKPGEGGRGYSKVTVNTVTKGSDKEEIFDFYCKRGNPKLFITHNATDVNGELSEWADGLAIQYYAPGGTKARDLFQSEDDLLIVGRRGVNLRMALAQLGKYTEGTFTFTLYSTGMHGEIFINVVSNAMSIDVARQMSKTFKDRDPLVCDAGTGETGMVDITTIK